MKVWDKRRGETLPIVMARPQGKRRPRRSRATAGNTQFPVPPSPPGRLTGIALFLLHANSNFFLPRLPFALFGRHLRLRPLHRDHPPKEPRRTTAFTPLNPESRFWFWTMKNGHFRTEILEEISESISITYRELLRAVTFRNGELRDNLPCGLRLLSVSIRIICKN
jgi:hypothetical protein